MEGCRIYDDSLWCSNSSSSSFYGTVSTVKFEDIERENKRDDERPLFMADSTDLDSKVENELEHTEKKRRLTSDQVQFLEKSFELENKLEPDRKIQLAKHVGLQPRQVAIWFQNRRARFKTKMLEKEYSSLKSSYDKLKADYDALYSDNDTLKNEVDLLRKRLKVHGDKVKREACDPISPLDFEPKNNTSDCTDGNHSSDLSQEEEDYDSLFKKSCFPKLEDECYDDLQPNSCNLGFPVQDQGTWFWQY